MNLRTEVRSLTIFIIALFLVFSAVSVIGEDVDVDYDDETVLSVQVNGVQLTYRNISQNGTLENGGYTILGDNQGDVGTETNVTLNFTAVGGLDTVEYFNVTAWFDNTTASGSQQYYDDVGSAPNYKWKLGMKNESSDPLGSWSLKSSHPNGEVILNRTELLYHNDTTQNWTIELIWGDQVKHAQSDTGAWEGPFDTPDTWNVNWTSAQPSYELNTTWQNEFGIYKYVSIAASHDPTGQGTPGSTVNISNGDGEMYSNLTFRSNDRFNISAQINQTLDNGTDAYLSDGTQIIGVDNVSVMTNWTGRGTIESLQSFSNIGEKLYLNVSGQPLGPYYSGNKSKMQTQWSVYIPLGQYADVYKTAITYKVDIDALF